MMGNIADLIIKEADSFGIPIRDMILILAVIIMGGKDGR